MNLEKIKEGTKKTGFKLEFDVSNILKKNGWLVINNKYYIDDLTDTVREVDIVAYKATKVDDIYVYTALIISCKKSDERDWALFSKERDTLDPNAPTNPIHLCSNDKVFNHISNKKEWIESYSLENINNGSDFISSITGNKNQVFAFQEMNKSKGEPGNDKNIFSSITGLMKAQSFEINTQKKSTKEGARIYQFNLISVIDSGLVRVDFKENDISPVEVESELYITDYIIHKKKTSSAINFIRFNSFEKLIVEYNKLHEANLVCFVKKRNEFYEEINKSNDSLNLFLDEILKQIKPQVDNLLSRRIENSLFTKDSCKLSYSDEDKIISLILPLESYEITHLNSNAVLRKRLKFLLLTTMKYKGDSDFGFDFMFNMQF